MYAQACDDHDTTHITKVEDYNNTVYVGLGLLFNDIWQLDYCDLSLKKSHFQEYHGPCFLVMAGSLTIVFILYLPHHS